MSGSILLASALFSARLQYKWGLHPRGRYAAVSASIPWLAMGLGLAAAMLWLRAPGVSDILVPITIGTLVLMMAHLHGGWKTNHKGAMETATLVLASVVAFELSGRPRIRAGAPVIDAWLTGHWLALPVAAVIVSASALAVAHAVARSRAHAIGNILVVAAVALISFRVGDGPLVASALLVGAALLGNAIPRFLPWQQLPCAGAACAGFATAWLLLQLPARNAFVSPWVAALLSVLPVTEAVLPLIRNRQRFRYWTGLIAIRDTRVHPAFAAVIAARSIKLAAAAVCATVSVVFVNQSRMLTLAALAIGVGYAAAHMILYRHSVTDRPQV